MISNSIHKEISHSCEIKVISFISSNIFVLELNCPKIANDCVPGQFVNVDSNQFLKRPISIYSANKEKGTITLAVRIMGKGTEYISKLCIGEKVNIIGPLGNGFTLPKQGEIILVGGGIGVFPLHFLLEEANRRGLTTTSICGFKSKDEAYCISRFDELSSSTCYASDNCDMDYDGNAASAFISHNPISGTTVYTCGPMPMMKAVSEYCINNEIECFVSLEERMGCGTGICLVCACKVKSANENITYKRCCSEGPVFMATEVIWD